MRLYVPCSHGTLAALLADGAMPGPVPACAVTPALRAWYPEGDDEELEYSAQSRAADLSLALIVDDASPRRIVLAVDARAEIDADVDAMVGASVPHGFGLSDVAAVLVDASDAIDVVRKALGALAASHEDVPAEVEMLDQHELAWFAAEELPAVLADL